MRTIQGKTEGDVTIKGESVIIAGMINGNLTVAAGADAQLSGMVTKDVVVTGGHLKIGGMVAGSVANRGGELEVFGMINGNLSREGGTTHVDPKAVINGMRA